MIYSVEDDAQIREMVLYALKQSGLAAEGFADANFWRAMARRSPSLILLDIMLPGEDGLSILRRLRQQPETAAIPVMMLTARGAEMEKVMGLNAGADDYLAKPFSILELVARVNALLRRVQPATREAPIDKGGILLDPEKHTVSVRGEPVVLTLKEFELLYYLMRNPGIACGRDRLLASVWDAAYPGNTRTVDVHVQTLRQKLGSAGNGIETVRGVGYRFRAER
ncbi:MAG TPA: response regulator transcription factor [Clostridia bacterium]|nr:response regulator transcription factor [Clostridia bacterium]